MLPRETATPQGEATFGRKLAYFSVVWIVATVLIGILLVAVSPLLSGLTFWLPMLA